MEYKVLETVQITTNNVQTVIVSLYNTCKQIKSTLISWYEFFRVDDTLELTEDVAPYFSGDIRFYLDEYTYLRMYIAQGTGSARDTILFSVDYAAHTTYTIQLVDRSGTGQVNCQFALFHIGNNIVISDCISGSVQNTDALSRGLFICIGTAFVESIQQSVPSAAVLANSITVDMPYFLSQPVRLGVVNKYVDELTTYSINNTDRSDVAAMTLICAADADSTMNDVLVSTYIPNGFANGFSTIEYNGHTYTQMGRYLFLDE